MDVEKVIKQLKKKYPNKSIVQNKNKKEIVTEILCEIEPTNEHPDWSNAIVVLDESTKHYHNETTETYKVLKGTLNLFVDNEKIILNKKDTYTITPNKVHHATGNETWFECRSKPGWKFEDYHQETNDKINMSKKNSSSIENLKVKSFVFFLPVETRPKSLPKFSHPRIIKFWHTGIVHKGFVYETFHREKYSKRSLDKRANDLIEQKAVFILINKIIEDKLVSELKSGTSCDEYVLRCLGLSNRSNKDKGQKFPDDVYKLLVKNNS